MNTRTNIVLDDALVAQAMVLARVTTKKAAVEAALRAYVKKPDYSGLLALEGSHVLADDYDPDEAYRLHPVEPLIAAERLPEAWASAGKTPKISSKTPGKTPGKMSNTATRKA
jgi:Arc/MetJ family transcription regulator